jgi:hypothetical protein
MTIGTSEVRRQLIGHNQQNIRGCHRNAPSNQFGLMWRKTNL